jgi:hypothetical protein
MPGAGCIEYAMPACSKTRFRLPPLGKNLMQALCLVNTCGLALIVFSQFCFQLGRAHGVQSSLRAERVAHVVRGCARGVRSTQPHCAVHQLARPLSPPLISSCSSLKYRSDVKKKVALF